MRLGTHRYIHPFFACAILSLLAAGPAAAQLPPIEVLHDGLLHQATGGAVVEVDAVSRRLKSSGIGSSGNDGVTIERAAGSSGYSIDWGDYANEFATPGCSHKHVLYGTVGGVSLPAVQLTVTTNSDGSETLSPDFSATNPTGIVIALLDAAGAVIRKLKGPKQGYDMKANKAVLAYSRGGPQTQSVVQQRSIRISSRSPYGESIEVRYTSPIIASDGNVVVACNGMSISRSDGDAVTDLGNCTVTGSWPAGSPPGSFSIDAEETDPPCAGLDCPNGPGTGSQLRVLDGNSVYAGGGPGAPMDMEIGAQGSENVSLGTFVVRPKGWCCLDIRSGQKVATANALQAPVGPYVMEWDALGSVNGTEQPLGRLTGTCAGGVCGCAADFSSVGASGVRVVLSLNGTVVADVADPPGGFELPSSFITEGPTPVAVTIPGGSSGSPGPAMMRIICITSPCPGWPVTMGGAVYFADQIDISPIEPMPGSSIEVASDITGIQLQTTGFSSMRILGGNDELTGTLAVPASDRVADFARPQLSPNPSSGQVRVVFALPQPARARVSVIDATGRRVRELANAAFGAGVHDLSWDGREQGGRLAPAGVYFVRVESGQSSRVSRVTRLW